MGNECEWMQKKKKKRTPGDHTQDSVTPIFDAADWAYKGSY